MRIRIDRKLPQLCTSILEVSGYVTGKKIPQQVQFKKKKFYFNAVWTHRISCAVKP
jgi:hypothetical protein